MKIKRNHTSSRLCIFFCTTCIFDILKRYFWYYAVIISYSIIRIVIMQSWYYTNIFGIMQFPVFVDYSSFMNNIALSTYDNINDYITSVRINLRDALWLTLRPQLAFVMPVVQMFYCTPFKKFYQRLNRDHVITLRCIYRLDIPVYLSNFFMSSYFLYLSNYLTKRTTTGMSKIIDFHIIKFILKYNIAWWCSLWFEDWKWQNRFPANLINASSWETKINDIKKTHTSVRKI